MALMSYEKGLELLLANIDPYEKVEKIAITECLGRILAEDIRASSDYPAFATASMDGYAVRFSEQGNALKIIGQVPAGTMPQFKPKKNECVKTFTGSLMSADLDTLVPVENVEIVGVAGAENGKNSQNSPKNSANLQKNSQNSSQIHENLQKNGKNSRKSVNFVDSSPATQAQNDENSTNSQENHQNLTLIIKQKVPLNNAVRAVGESYKKGEILLKKGTRLEFSELALLAELGFFHISVFIKPVIGVLSSGNELKDLGESLDNPAQIRSSNHIAIASLARSFNARAVIFPLLKDEPQAAKAALTSALQSCDILITTGGVSVGDFDFLKEAIKGYELIIDKLDIKPGRHIKIAKSGKKFILAFPGFPYSSMVAFHLYAREILNTWLCQKKDYVIKAFLKGTYAKKSPYFEFVACNVEFDNGRVCVNLRDKKQGSSAIIGNLNHKAALMLVSKDRLSIKEGELVDIMLLS